MRENYANMKRVFMALDKHLDGFVSIKDLKQVLTQFTVPLSDQLFMRLMDRCASHVTSGVYYKHACVHIGSVIV